MIKENSFLHSLISFAMRDRDNPDYDLAYIVLTGIVFKESTSDDDMDFYSERVNDCVSLDDAFTWRETVLGQDYWRRLDDDFNEWLDTDPYMIHIDRVNYCALRLTEAASQPKYIMQHHLLRYSNCSVMGESNVIRQRINHFFREHRLIRRGGSQPTLDNPVFETTTEEVTPIPVATRKKALHVKARDKLFDRFPDRMYSRAMFAIAHTDLSVRTFEKPCHSYVQDDRDTVELVVSSVANSNDFHRDRTGSKRRSSRAYNAFYDWVINHSIYSGVIKNTNVKSLRDQGLTVQCRGNTRHLVLAACSLSRFSREWHYNMIAWHDMVKAGVEGHIALALCYMFAFGWDRRSAGPSGLDSMNVQFKFSDNHDHWVVDAFRIDIDGLLKYAQGIHSSEYDYPFESDTASNSRIASVYNNVALGRRSSLANKLKALPVNKSCAFRGWGALERSTSYSDLLEAAIPFGLDLTAQLSAVTTQEAA